MSLKFVLVFIVVMIGRWSEWSSVMVFQFVCLCSESCIVVMSGDVFCCLGLLGTLVGVFVFRMMWFEFWSASSMMCPLWSLSGECHVVECAFMSPVIRLLVMFVVCWMNCVIVWSLMMLCWSLGGM